MFLADGVGPSTIQLFHLFTVCHLQRAKQRHIAWLQLMGGVGWKPTEDDVILKTESQDFQRFVHRKAIADKNPRLTIRSRFGKRVKHMLNPVQTNFGVGISSFGAGEVSSRGGVRGPGASMRDSGPDD
jgi:hypothetical protein